LRIDLVDVKKEEKQAKQGEPQEEIDMLNALYCKSKLKNVIYSTTGESCYWNGETLPIQMDVTEECIFVSEVIN
jgi:hypothetical protein